MHKTHELIAEPDIVALGLDVLEEHVVARRGLIGHDPAVLAHGHNVLGATRGMLAGISYGAELASSGEHGIDPVHNLGGVVNPHLDEVAIALARGVTADLVENLHAIHLADLRGVGAVDGAEVLAALRDGLSTVHSDEVEAQVAGRSGSSQATVAGATYDKDVALIRGDNVGSVNLGLLAKPCGVGASLGNGVLGGAGGNGRGSGFLGHGGTGEHAGTCKAEGAKGGSSNETTAIHECVPFSLVCAPGVARSGHWMSSSMQTATLPCTTPQV